MSPASIINDFQVDAVLCDSAVTAEGKLFVQGGGWDKLTPPHMPFRQARIGLGVVLTVPYTATNENHKLIIRLEHEDGGLVAADQTEASDPPPTPPDPNIEAQFNVGRPPILQPGDAQALAFAVNLDGVMFNRPGGYSFVFSIDGTEIRRLPFRVHGAAQQNLSAD